MSKMIMRLEGMDGVVELMSDRVVVLHPGLWNMIRFGTNSTRELPLGAISEIGFKNANVLVWGEIDFIVGTRPMPIPGQKKKVSPTSVRFKKDKQKQFEALKDKVFELMAQHSRQSRA
jgi:hypothetical protein